MDRLNVPADPCRTWTRAARTVALGVAIAGIAVAASEPVSAAITPRTSVTVTVKVKVGVPMAAVATRLRFIATRPLLASRGIYHVDVAVSGRDTVDPNIATRVTDRLRKDAAFVYVEPDDSGGPDHERFFAWIDGKADSVGSDPSRWLQQPALEMIGAAEAQMRTRGAGVVVAVLDTGADMTHPSLEGRFVGGYDYVDDDAQPADVGNGRDDDRDGRIDEAVGHGTFVAGIVSLVAPEAKLWVGRVLDSDGRGSAAVVAEALRDAVAAGATVVNMSFGVGTKLYSPALESAIRDARAAGVIIIAAAGNNALPSAFYPAATTGVVSVGAIQASAPRLSVFSNYGKWVDVAAPGERIVSTTPGGFSAWSGTSAAAPFVAGQAALLRSIDSLSKADRIVEYIRSTSRRLDKPYGSTLSEGVIDLPASLAKVAALPLAPDKTPVTSNVVVYDDALVNADDWGWAPHTYSSATPIQSGSRAIAVAADPWTGLQIGLRTPYKVQPGSVFEFWINAEAGGQTITLELFNSTTRKVRIPLGYLPANQWRKVQFNLRDFVPGDTVTTIIFYADRATSGGRYSLDNIRFIS